MHKERRQIKNDKDKESEKKRRENNNECMQTMNNAPSTCVNKFLETFRVMNLGGYHSTV